MNNSQWDEARGGGWTKRTNRGEGKFFFHRTNRIVENWTMTLFSRKRSALLLYFLSFILCADVADCNCFIGTLVYTHRFD